MRCSTVLIAVVTVASLSACNIVRIEQPQLSEGPPKEWRGKMYRACHDLIATATQIESLGVPADRPASAVERSRLERYIAATEALAYGDRCNRTEARVSNDLIDSVSFIGKATASVPADVSAQGPQAVQLYERMIANDHSADDIRAYIASGKFEEHMALRRLL